MRINNLFRIKTLGARTTWRMVPILMVVAIGLSACSAFQAPVPVQTGGNSAIPTGVVPAATMEDPAEYFTPDNMSQAAATQISTGMADAMEAQEYGTPVTTQMADNTDIPATGNASPKAYVGLFKDNAVAVLDTVANKVLKTIPVPTGPHGMAIAPDGRWVYVSSDGDSKVSVIDTQSDTIVKSIEVGQAPHGLALTSDGRTLLAAVFGASQVAFIDTASGQVTGQVSVPSPHNIAIRPDDHTAYVAAQKQGAAGLAVIDLPSKSQIAFLPLDKAPRALSFSPDGKQLYFTQAGVDMVQALDPATNQITARIDVGASPHHPLFDPDPKASMALVVAQGPGEVDFIDTQSNVAFFNLPTGQMPHWIAIDSRGTTALVTNEGSNTVSVIDLNKFTVTATIPVGNGPRKLVVQPGQPMMAHKDAADAMDMRTLAAPPASSATVAPAAPLANSVLISGMAFSSANITIKAGQTVTWTNRDAIPHTVTSDQAFWDSSPVPPGGSFSQTFTQPGTYAYHCTLHPFMTGQVTVTP